MHDVARVAGVSHATVSRVVNGHTNVAPATAQAVADAIITTGYVPNRAARSLRIRATGTVILVARENVDVFYTEPTLSPMASGANLRLSEHGYQMLLALVDSPRSEEHVGSLIAGGSFDAAILVAMTNEDPLIARLMATNIPLVTASTPFPGSDVPSVDTDNVGGARAITERLVASGRSRIVAIGGPSWAPVTRLRLDGFHQGAKNAAIAHTTVTGWTLGCGERAMSELLERYPDLDGVVAASDLLATGAIRVLNKAGRQVPQDVSVVGFDDAPVAALNDPPLSTVRGDARATGAALADMAVAQIRGQNLPQRHLVLPNDVIWRESA
ncbi:LacI family DNA-binding transcriptional regulator [Cutibacterium sp.]|uniref:LacI family DNA-binding transcriptional regulator n=1 Tax=Cutibacterium sp. TaxID=1912221 RepID=UPI0026DA91AE|nr:LacI family DNA-binding transcriptional regulator [Cutibacterium sp.]MDO4412515.1 LacI family DNA-binding transcriptional regulator [Cutibacterium sp.]